MSTSNKIATSVTLPAELFVYLDAAAEAAERSRSWVISRVLEQHFQNSTGFSSPAGRGSDGQCLGQKNPVDQREAPFQAPRLVESPTSAVAPAAEVGRFQTEHARRHLEAKERQEAALSEARRIALEQMG
ncbi:MAG TPA: hypothetical protein VHB27_11985 [Rhodopila sp.]|uniref:hypothetical protein n=1 Tax=Rhodopila sp. TaxID=2480087 RepID=UPI002C8F4D66|nr:hypothetical protein [Rhodopila sp.]HVY15940.1 hypothetical protein [Rhodopila sp.]